MEQLDGTQHLKVRCWMPACSDLALVESGLPLHRLMLLSRVLCAMQASLRLHRTLTQTSIVACAMQTTSRMLAPIMKGDGKTLMGMNNQDAFTEAVAAQRKVCACALTYLSNQDAFTGASPFNVSCTCAGDQLNCVLPCALFVDAVLWVLFWVCSKDSAWTDQMPCSEAFCCQAQIMYKFTAHARVHRTQECTQMMRHTSTSKQRLRCTAEASMRDCRVTGPITTLLPELPPPPREVEVDGIFVPDKPLTTTADVNYVLNQEPGKLRIKDIKHAIQRCACATVLVEPSGALVPLCL
eukprot:647823-Pelagomonas_calceolata.AAC.4